MGTSKVFTVKFDSNFDEFAARTAYALRFMIVYRTDGGKFARGLVRASGDLQNTHHDLLQGSVPNGAPIRLIARLYRRKDPVAANRWVMSIQFAIPDKDMIRGDNETIVASPEGTDRSQEKMMQQMIHYGTLWFRSHQQLNDRTRRILYMLEIADRLGYPNNWNMWYYSRPAVYQYIRWEAKEPDRRRMSQATNGKFPFDGDTGGPQPVNWKIYPFREAAKRCNPQDVNSCQTQVVNELIHTEDEIRRTYSEIDKQMARVAPANGSIGSKELLNLRLKGRSDASGLGPLAAEFLQHLDDLTNNQNTLYSVYLR
jgi:hypothetical protein